MKVFVGMPVYNNELTVAAAIRSVYDYVDRIIVVNGSNKGPSTDRTVREAKSVGNKVVVVSGTFIASDGSWGEQKQRQTCLNLMPKGGNKWCIFQDADEVFDDEQIKNLIKHMKNAPKEVRIFIYNIIHFFRDTKHIITGGQWDHRRAYQAFRLKPDVRMRDFNRVGTKKSAWDLCEEPTKVILDDVFYYHYGHVLSFERYEFKVRHFVEQGLCRGYKKDEWERYRKEKFIPFWKKSWKEIQGVKPFFGKHPEEVLHILDKLDGLWKKNEGPK